MALGGKSSHLLVSSDTGTLCKWDELWGVDCLPLVPELFSRELRVSLDILEDLNESGVWSHGRYRIVLQAPDALLGIIL